MKNSAVVLLLLFSFFTFAQQAPKVQKTEFPKATLSQKLTTIDGQKVSVGEILKQYKGRLLIIDFWASWCQDCIRALPGTTQLKEEFPNVDFVYFSLDRNENQWKNGLEKYNLNAQKNYWFDEGWKNPFNNAIDLNWVPRFILVDQKGKIAKYYSISPEDPELRAKISEQSVVRK